MYTHKDLISEIEQVVQEKNVKSERVKKDLVTVAILAAHRFPSLPDFYAYNTTENIKHAVGAYLSKLLKRDFARDDSQAAFDFMDFDCLQPMYQITHGDESWLVPLEAMTDAEIDMKMAEHEAQGEGHYRHRDELGRYKKMRSRSATA